MIKEQQEIGLRLARPGCYRIGRTGRVCPKEGKMPVDKTAQWVQGADESPRQCQTGSSALPKTGNKAKLSDNPPKKSP